MSQWRAGEELPQVELVALGQIETLDDIIAGVEQELPTCGHCAARVT
jgi:hypothetical protein